MKAIVRLIRDQLATPIYAGVFSVLPLRALAYLVGMIDDADEPFGRKALRHLIGGQMRRASAIYNARLCRLPTAERRARAREVWQSESADSYGQRAFRNPEARCANYAYDAVHDLFSSLRRPLRILELGCANASSYHCFAFRGIDVERYCGIDINARLIAEGQARFGDRPNFTLRSADFLEHLSNEDDSYDILFVKQVFLFLDQDYVESLLGVVSDKRLADRIVFEEKVLKRHEGDRSTVMELGFSPVTYSHNYGALLAKHGFEIESGGKSALPGSADVAKFLAVVKRVPVPADAAGGPSA